MTHITADSVGEVYIHFMESDGEAKVNSDNLYNELVGEWFNLSYVLKVN